MTPHVQACSLAAAALVACAALCGRCRAGADIPPPHPAVEVLRQRGRQREAEKPLWRALATYAERDLEEGRREDFWRALAAADGRPVLLRKSFALRVGAALPHFVPFEVEYRLWLVPAPGRVLLFGYPAQYAENYNVASTVYHEVKKRLERRDDDPEEVRAEKLKRTTEIEQIGPLRFAFLFVALTPERRLVGTATPVIEVSSDGIVARVNRRRHALRIPESSRLERELGRPLLLPPLADAEKLYLALDWSEYLAGQPRSWLLEELRGALEGFSAEQLAGGGVHFHGKGRAVGWPLADLRKGTWPAALPEPHQDNTLGALADALRDADGGQPVHVTFFTWNPGESIPAEKAAQELPASVTARASRLSLQVIQMVGPRLPCFEKLAGMSYFRAAYRPKGPPSLILPPREP